MDEAAGEPPVRETRGKSRPGRLSALDQLFGRLLGGWFRDAPPAAPVVDLGFGAYPWTLRDLARTVRTVAPERPVVGVEAHPTFAERGAFVLRRDRIPCVLGGFDLPDAARPACVVRVMNVLRSYPAEEGAAALDAIAQGVVPGGWIVDGACGLDGDAMVTRWWQVGAGGERTLAGRAFGATLDAGCAPGMFQARIAPDEASDWHDPTTSLGALIGAWKGAWSETAGGGDGPARWARAAEILGSRGWPVEAPAIGSGVWLWAGRTVR